MTIPLRGMTGHVVARYDESVSHFDTPAQFYLGSRRLGYYGGATSTYTKFVHPNALGSTMMITDQTTAVVNDTLWYPWGDFWQDTQVNGQSFAGSRMRRWESGLDFSATRAYNYGYYRWLSPDLVGGDTTNPQSLNRYAYVLNNPTTLTDPSGLFAPGPCLDPNSPGCGNPFIDEFFFNALFGFSSGPVNPDLRDRPGAGGDRPAKPSKQPVITNPSQTGPQQTTLNQLLNALACDPECTAFLAQKGLDPVQTLMDIINNNLYGHADISVGGKPYTNGAVSGGVAGQAITVNNQGAFFSGSAPGGLTLGVGPNNIPGGTPAAQAFILLHELGHNTAVLRPDAGVPKAGKQNDKDIEAHCEKTINSFK